MFETIGDLRIRAELKVILMSIFADNLNLTLFRCFHIPFFNDMGINDRNPNGLLVKLLITRWNRFSFSNENCWGKNPDPVYFA